MITRKLYKEQWRSYFEWISAEARNRPVIIRIVSEGGSTPAPPLTLERVVYDTASDLLEICTCAMDHAIPQPVRIYVDEFRDAVTSIEVVQSNGNHQLIRLEQPVRLPSVDS